MEKLALKKMLGFHFIGASYDKIRLYPGQRSLDKQALLLAIE